jgi:hypothetical protein
VFLVLDGTVCECDVRAILAEEDEDFEPPLAAEEKNVAVAGGKVADSTTHLPADFPPSLGCPDILAEAGQWRGGGLA